MDNSWVAFGKPALYNARSVWWPYRRRMTGQLIALAQFEQVAVSPAATATILVATTAPTLAREITLSPAATATITVSTSAPTLAREITLAPAATATITVATEAPTLVRHVTASPAVATVLVATTAPTLVRDVTAAPATATILVATEAPGVATDSAISPAATATILVATEAPTVSYFKEVIVAPATATILVATTAPSLDYIYETTITPAGPATILVDTNPPTVVQGEGLRRWPIFISHTRRWVYSSEGYREDIQHQRRYVIPMKPEATIPVSAEATITVQTEAPTLGLTVGTELSIQVLSPARIQVGGLFQPYPAFPFFAYTPPTLLRTNPSPAMITNSRSTGGRVTRVWRPPSRYVPGRVPAKRRPDHVTYVEQRQRTRRAVVFDYFNVGQKIVQPAQASIQVRTEASTIGTDLQLGISPSVATIQVRAQGPDILLNGVSALSAEIVMMTISMRRRQLAARRSNYRLRIPMQTRMLVGFAEPRPQSFVEPAQALITVATQAPTLLTTSTIAPTEATILVATEAPTVSETALYQPEQTATLLVVTEAPTVAGRQLNISPAQPATVLVVTEAPTVTAQQVVISPARPATIIVSRGTPNLTGINTVVFPGTNGIDTVEILVSTGAPVVYIQKWIKENAASSAWTAETSASDGWDRVASASNNWRK